MSRHWRGEGTGSHARELALDRTTLRSILEHNARKLILTRQVRTGTYEIHDKTIVQQNTRHRREARPDLQEDSFVCLAEVAGIDETALHDLTFATVRQAGFRTQRDFYDAWVERHRIVELARLVVVAEFRIVEDARFLHAKAYRGYTRNPSEAARGEFQALSRVEQERFSREARERDELRRRGRLAEAQSLSLAERLERVERERRGRRGVDVSGEFRVIRDRIERGERAAGEEDAA